MRSHPSFSVFDAARGAKRGTCYAQCSSTGSVCIAASHNEALFDIDQLQPSEIAGVEYYASAAQTPPELNATTSGTCGVLVIWTR